MSKCPRTIQQSSILIFPYLATTRLYQTEPTLELINGTESVHNMFVIFCMYLQGQKYTECAFWCSRFDFSSLICIICLAICACLCSFPTSTFDICTVFLHNVRQFQKFFFSTVIVLISPMSDWLCLSCHCW